MMDTGTAAFLLVAVITVILVIIAVLMPDKKGNKSSEIFPNDILDGFEDQSEIQNPNVDKAEMPREWPYYASKLMSIPEQQLYWKLKKALPDYLIAFQVQTSRVLKVKKGFNFQSWHNRINRLSYDFVICNKQSYPIAVIELDDSSHDSGDDRQDTDQKKNKATNDAGLKIYRWRVNQTPSHDEIKALFDGKQ